MLELGVEPYEFLPAMAPATDWSGLASDSTSLHAKNLVIDDRGVFVGSVNLDARSLPSTTPRWAWCSRAGRGRACRRGCRWRGCSDGT